MADKVDRDGDRRESHNGRPDNEEYPAYNSYRIWPDSAALFKLSPPGSKACIILIEAGRHAMDIEG